MMKSAAICFSVVVTLPALISVFPLHAHDVPREDWRPVATERLKAIYDRNEFRVPEVEAEWLDDSSAFRIREKDPQTGKTVTAQYDVVSGVRQVMKAEPDPNQLQSPDGVFTLKVRDGNLFLKEQGDNETPLTAIEVGRDVAFRDFRWSSSGKAASFVKVDRTDVRLRSVLVPTEPSYPGVAEHRFARVGGTIEGREVGIVDCDRNEVRWVSLETHVDGFYLGQVDWVPNSNELLIETLSRFRDKREFWLTTIDGNAKRIYQEVNEAWAVGSHGINSGAHWIREGEAFILISEKEGWRQAYVCSRDGKVESKLTPGEYDIIDRAFVDEAGGWYYFYASPDNGTQKYLHRVPLDGSGKLERLSPQDQPGTHDYVFSPNAKLAIHTYSTLNDPPVVDLVRLPGHNVVRVINDHAELRKKFIQAVPRRTEFVQIDIGDDVVMDACITKPSDFDETKKYPVLVYVYGEPYLQTVLDDWGAAQTDFHRVVADTGYVVVSIDNRGTACPKGAAWRRSIFGSLGPLSTEDQAAALKKLAKLEPYVDLSRVAIWGWSGGGSNTLNAMFRKPDVYHVGIAVVPKPQPWLYNAWFQEIYMRTREVNADGYQRSAPINFAEGLKGKLLIITGSGETNTHIQIIEGLVDRLIELGKPFDYMVYPNRDHGLREGQGTVVHVRMKILRYLIENLPRGPR
ncbi:S9 family peptidase [Novipirellula artificiosorum]|uniref:Prolyl tripeptidyl peptidase n=1 Tax=Novipirellula artificiosorum TaxID=2528016 RepID=A0A5C6DNQ7_9BACT|nr:DPP IV N-terminal domain-containing protein [Novipirellula artificiosorum]TWU38242.1 Prolyl tripeptidyl peptidase precursor [Novipirellula artificiosorum]